MEDIKNIGYIYKITNLINGKCYIGQTSRTIEERFKQHLKDSKKEERINYPLYRAFNKYGLNNFEIIEIEKCEIEKLNEREVYWIDYYNSFYDGYNQTLGGEGSSTLNLDEKEVIKKYEELRTLSKVANFYKCSSDSIKIILDKNNFVITSSFHHTKNNAKTILQYSMNGTLLNIFQSYIEVGDWLLENKLSNASNGEQAGFYLFTKLKLEEYEFKGYIWKFEKDFSEEYKKEFKEKFKIKKKNEGKNFCPICGKLKDKKYLNCTSCSKDKKKNIAQENREEKYNISRNILKEKIRVCSFLQIGKEYGVSDNTIRKWCKAYNLPFKTSEIKSYSDEEWEKL